MVIHIHILHKQGNRMRRQDLRQYPLQHTFSLLHGLCLRPHHIIYSTYIKAVQRDDKCRIGAIVLTETRSLVLIHRLDNWLQLDQQIMQQKLTFTQKKAKCSPQQFGFQVSPHKVFSRTLCPKFTCVINYYRPNAIFNTVCR